MEKEYLRKCKYVSKLFVITVSSQLDSDGGAIGGQLPLS